MKNLMCDLHTIGLFVLGTWLGAILSTESAEAQYMRSRITTCQALCESTGRAFCGGLNCSGAPPGQNCTCVCFAYHGTGGDTNCYSLCDYGDDMVGFCSQ